MASKKTTPLKAVQKCREIPHFFERVELTTKLEAMHSPASPLRRGLNKRFLFRVPEINSEYYQVQYDEDHFNFHKETNFMNVGQKCDWIEDSDGNS